MQAGPERAARDEFGAAVRAFVSNATLDDAQYDKLVPLLAADPAERGLWWEMDLGGENEHHAFLFVFTLLSSIGYGHFVPHTEVYWSLSFSPLTSRQTAKRIRFG